MASTGICVVRVHNRSRRKLFTPPDVKTDDRLHDSDFHGLRVTKGIYEDGPFSCVKDSWLSPRRAHEVMANPWTGIRIFIAVAMRPEPGDLVRVGVLKAFPHIVCTTPKCLCVSRVILQPFGV